MMNLFVNYLERALVVQVWASTLAKKNIVNEEVPFLTISSHFNTKRYWLDGFVFERELVREPHIVCFLGHFPFDGIITVIIVVIVVIFFKIDLIVQLGAWWIVQYKIAETEATKISRRIEFFQNNQSWRKVRCAWQRDTIHMSRRGVSCMILQLVGHV